MKHACWLGPTQIGCITTENGKRLNKFFINSVSAYANSRLSHYMYKQNEKGKI